MTEFDILGWTSPLNKRSESRRRLTAEKLDAKSMKCSRQLDSYETLCVGMNKIIYDGANT